MAKSLHTAEGVDKPGLIELFSLIEQNIDCPSLGVSTKSRRKGAN